MYTVVVQFIEEGILLSNHSQCPPMGMPDNTHGQEQSSPPEDCVAFQASKLDLATPNGNLFLMFILTSPTHTICPSLLPPCTTQHSSHECSLRCCLPYCLLAGSSTMS